MKGALLFFSCILLLLAGCIQPPQPQGNGKFFEATAQDPECQNNICFYEIFALDDGLVMVKKHITGSDYGISFCDANREKQSALFSFLEQNLKENKLGECGGCHSLHIFYNNGTTTRYSSIPYKSAVFEKQFFNEAQGICSAATEAEFIHVIFGKKDKYSDYHIFSNNKMVVSKFGLREGELLESGVDEISAAEFSEMKSFIPEQFFSSKAPGNCQANGYFYGYFEAYIGGKYNYAFTCGDGSDAGKAFLAFAGRFSE